MDVSELEGLGSGLWCGRVSVLSGSEEPEEGDDDEVNDVCIGGTVVGMSGVKDVPELAQDCGVDWVGAAWGIVVVGESFEESSAMQLNYLLTIMLCEIDNCFRPLGNYP